MSIKGTRKPLADLTHQDPTFKDRSTLYKSFISFPNDTIKPGEVLTFRTFSNVPFKPKRLVVCPKYASDLMITSIRSGKWEIFLNTHGVPATAFPPLPTTVEDHVNLKDMEALLELNVDAVMVGETISLVVENIGKQEAVFGALFWGTYGNDYPFVQGNV